MHPLAHALTGALIGQVAPSLTLGFLGGVASHFVLDVIPHAEGRTFRGSRRGQAKEPDRLGVEHLEAAVELGLAVALLWWVDGHCDAARILNVTLGALGGLLPDLIDVPAQVLFRRPLLHADKWHRTVGRDRAALGVLTQIAAIAATGAGLWLTSGCRW